MAINLAKGFRKITNFLGGRTTAGLLGGVSTLFGINFLDITQEAAMHFQTVSAAVTAAYMFAVRLGKIFAKKE